MPIIEDSIIQRKTQLEQVAEWYNEGLTPVDMASRLNKDLNSIHSAISVARRKGLLDSNIKNNQDKIADLYHEGKSRDEIMEILELSPRIFGINLAIAKRRGLLKEEDMKWLRTKDILASKNEQQAIDNKIKEMYEDGLYPLDIADSLNVTGKQVYDVIDKLSGEELKRIKRKGLRENPLSEKIVDKIKSSGMRAKDALEEVSFELDDPNERIELARVYYIIGNFSGAKETLNDIVLDDEIDERTRRDAAKEKSKIDLESRSVRIRRECKLAQKEKKQVSYDELCRKYNVRMNFIENIMGSEQRQL